MNNNKTPFCKVCFDSGKPDTKHWVKDRNGKVCCPTLLALKCRLCDQCGHTVKYCSKAAVAPQPYKAQAQVAPLAPVPQQKAPINKYDLLFNDDSDEEQEEQEQEQEEQVKVKVKKPEQEVKKQQPKRWIDYDSDFDDEPLPIPTLKRYGHSDQSDESFVGARM